MREVLLLRHGLTEANERHVFTGATDLPISAKGRAQLLARKSRYPQAVRFFTSGMLRTRQTLEVLYGDVPHTDIPDLAECCFGRFELRSHADLFAHEPVYRAWLGPEPDSLEVVLPGGESRRAFAQRVQRGWTALTRHSWEGLAVLVSHGGVLRNLCGGDITVQNGCGWRATLSADGHIERLEAFS